MSIAILLLSAVITVPAEPAQASEAGVVRLAERAHPNMVAIAPAAMMAVSADDMTRVERVPGSDNAQVVSQVIGDNGSGEYVPFAGAGWRWNEVYNATYPHTDDGPDYWPSIREDGLGTLWAVYQGVNASYSYDTIYVFCSTDNGSTWLYRVAISGSPANYDPIFPQLSVDRVGNWVYIANILAEQDGSGQYYTDGTLWVTRFQHTGGGAISNLGTYKCDPQGWGGLYFGCAAAPDGSGSSYLYLCGMDWVGSGGDYLVDYYRSSDRGATWTYVSSNDMGTSITNCIAGTPINGGTGALIGWIEPDDANNGDGSGANENDYDFYWRELTSSTHPTYYFDAGGAYFRGLFSMAAYGTMWVAPFDEARAASNFDAYFYYYDGSSYWLYTWDNTATDVRSLATDMIPQNNAVLMSSYRQSSGLNGRPYFAWATTADMAIWYPYSVCDYDVFNADAITVPSGATTKHTDVAATPVAFGGYSWQPHIMWRRTSGAAGGGDPWHSWPDPSVGTEESAGGPGLFVAFVGKGIAYSVPGKTNARLSVYDATGRMVCGTENTLSGKGILQLPDLNQGVYFFTFTTDEFGSTRGRFALK
ncbi:MAG: T9SS type A sorting domain-containing protein [candidate division WOR-3 bacterium]